MSLTRTTFEKGLQQWLAKKTLLKTYSWTVEPFTGYGYLEGPSQAIRLHNSEDRVEKGTQNPDEVAQVEDEAISSANHAFVHLQATLDYHVVYSASYQVPVLYFRAHDRAGSLLPLDRLLQSDLFQVDAGQYPLSTLRDAPDDEVAEEDDTATARYPAISHGDHPHTGQPCYFLHPCETTTMLREILHSEGREQEIEALRIFETWFMLVRSVINLD